MQQWKKWTGNSMHKVTKISHSFFWQRKKWLKNLKRFREFHLRRFGSPKNAMDFKKNIHHYRTNPGGIAILAEHVKHPYPSSEGAVRMDRRMSPSWLVFRCKESELISSHLGNPRTNEKKRLANTGLKLLDFGELAYLGKTMHRSLRLLKRIVVSDGDIRRNTISRNHWPWQKVRWYHRYHLHSDVLSKRYPFQQC